MSPSPKTQKTLKDLCEEYFHNKSFKISEFESFAQTIQNRTIEMVAQSVEDGRYDLPGREAEWSRFIARKIRLMKGGLN